MKLHVSRGNIKLGGIPNVSLPPGLSCEVEKPCWRLCYARKAYEVYAAKSAGMAWKENWDLWRSDPVGYEIQLGVFLQKTKSLYFRYHVGGDIPSVQYANMMKRTALVFPEITFLVYTRRRWMDEADLPKNLIVWQSYWLDEVVRGEPTQRIAQVIPKGSNPPGFTCPGDCRACLHCFQPGNYYVQFHLH